MLLYILNVFYIQTHVNFFIDCCFILFFLSYFILLLFFFFFDRLGFLYWEFFFLI